MATIHAAYINPPTPVFCARVLALSAAFALLPSCSLFEPQTEEGSTTLLTLVGNLDAREPIPTKPWDPLDPAGTARISASLSVRDEHGIAHDVTLYFRKADINQFEYHVIADGDEVEPPVPGLNVQFGAGQLYFDTDGGLLKNQMDQPIHIPFLDTEQELEIQLDFGDDKESGGEGKAGLTQYALNTSINVQKRSELPPAP